MHLSFSYKHNCNLCGKGTNQTLFFKKGCNICSKLVLQKRNQKEQQYTIPHNTKLRNTYNDTQYYRTFYTSRQYTTYNTLRPKKNIKYNKYHSTYNKIHEKSSTNRMKEINTSLNEDRYPNNLYAEKNNFINKLTKKNFKKRQNSYNSRRLIYKGNLTKV